jgi:large subunit ribosomal protein L15
MAAPFSIRLISDVFKTNRPRLCQRLRNKTPNRCTPQLRREVSTATPYHSEMEVETSTPPRWSRTPPAMKAPVSMRRRSVGGQHDVNKDPHKLDDMYISFLGKGGDKMLSEETKWLAVTHKSFDHGRRGFNDRLAFLGEIIDIGFNLC